NGTGTFSAIIVPRDTMANRPNTTSVNGMIRYNTNTSKFEAYEAGAWANMVGGGASQWTTSAPNIYYTTGNVGIGVAAPTDRLHVYLSTITQGGLLVENPSNSSNAMAQAFVKNDAGNAGGLQIASSTFGTTWQQNAVFL